MYVNPDLTLSTESLVTSLIAKWPRLKTSNVWIFIGLLQKWKMAYAFNGNEKESTVNAGLKSSPWFIFPIFQEYERAVIFRLGRLLKSGARGPGVFFIIPCVDHYEKIDMRTQTYDVPPQEVGRANILYNVITNTSRESIYWTIDFFYWYVLIYI